MITSWLGAYCKLRTWGGGLRVDQPGSKTRCAGSPSCQAANFESKVSSILDNLAGPWLDALSVYIQLKISLITTDKRHSEVKVETLYAGEPG